MEIGTQIKALRLRKGVTQEAIAQAQEVCGNDAEAIAALNEEIEVAARDWSITEGEFVDKIRREIARLERGSKKREHGFEHIQSVCHAQHLRQPTGIHRQAAAKSISF